MDLTDLDQQRLVSALAGRGAAALPGVEARAGHPGDPTQIDNAVLGLVLLNEAEAGHRIVSRAK
jgi:hypothetical protein